MKKIDKINLLDLIGRTLQSKMSYSDIDIYLSGFGIDIKNKQVSGVNSKWVYVKEILANESDKTILDIADELEIDHPYAGINENIEIPDFWKKGHFKLFLSHLASFKVQTSKLQKALLKYAISAFVAHEDIEPTREWQVEIEKALMTMDGIVAILTEGFNKSNWTDQEIGIAIGRNILVIPVRKGMDPYGFFGKYQGFQGERKTVAEVARGIYDILVTHSKTKEKMLSALIEKLLFTKTQKDAEDSITIIEEIYDLPQRHIEKLKDFALNNDVIAKSKIMVSRINSILERYNLSHLGH